MASTISRLGQISLTVTDLDRAKEFYRDRVGLAMLFEAPNMAFFRDTEGNVMALMCEKR